MERTAAYWEIRERIEKMVDARNEIVTGDDGYAVFWPTKGRGYHSAYELRILADILDDRNMAWEKTVKLELMREP